MVFIGIIFEFAFCLGNSSTRLNLFHYLEPKFLAISKLMLTIHPLDLLVPIDVVTANRQLLIKHYSTSWPFDR